MPTKISPDSLGSFIQELTSLLPAAPNPSSNGNSHYDLTCALQQAVEELRAAEDELIVAKIDAESERNRYRDLFEFAPDGYLVTDRHAKILEANQAAVMMLNGKRDRAIIGKPLMLFIDRADRSLFFNLLTAMRSADRGKWKLRFVARDGTKFVIDLTVAPIRQSLDDVQELRWLMRDETEQARMEQEAVKHRDQLGALAVQLARAQEQERARIAVGVHDRISQTLIVAKMLVRQLSENAKKPDGILDELTSLLEQAIAESRSLTFELCPPILHQLGVTPAIQWLIEEIAKRNGSQFRIVDRFSDPMFGTEEIRSFLFQAVRELLMNIAKHSAASEGTIELIEHPSGWARVTVTDNGIGFHTDQNATGPENRTAGFGLFNIKNRIEQIGGWFNIKSSPAGTSVTIIVPKTSSKGTSCPPAF